MSTSTFTCQNICEIDSQYPDQTNTGSCDCGYYTGKVNNCFFNFPQIYGTIPAGALINSATLKLEQVSGGYNATENMDITVRFGSWYVMTWNNQAPQASGSPTVDVSLTGSGAGIRSFDLKSIVQWLVDNQNTSHIIKLARDPNTASGTLDAKRFSTTAGDHSLEVDWTPRTAARFMARAAEL